MVGGGTCGNGMIGYAAIVGGGTCGNGMIGYAAIVGGGTCGNGMIGYAAIVGGGTCGNGMIGYAACCMLLDVIAGEAVRAKEIWALSAITATARTLRICNERVMGG